MVEFGEGRRKWSSSATVALGCPECGLSIIPCLICAHPIIPSVSSSSIATWKECENCGVRNPMDDQERCLLEIYPTCAMPLPVVRNVQVARIGRRAYTLTKLAQKLSVERASDSLEHAINKVFSHGERNEEKRCTNAVDKRNFKYQKVAEHIDFGGGSSAISPCLPFLESEGIYQMRHRRLDLSISKANHNHLPGYKETAECVRGTVTATEVSSHADGIAINPPLRMNSGVLCACSKASEGIKSVDVNLESAYGIRQESPSSIEPPKNVDPFLRINDTHGPAENVAMLVPQSEGSKCLTCGRQNEVPTESQPCDYGIGFVRCCSQLLELLCAQTLSADDNRPCGTYPICISSRKALIGCGKSGTHLHRVGKRFGFLSIEILRSVHSILKAHSTELLSTTNGQDFGFLQGLVEDALKLSELFVQKRAGLEKLQYIRF
ncbi:hypothetical protein O6H91_04G140600 [Diphasiastrum complanatum]|uniref:Uncharacterized protein n=1 Tax=Diphasiastrum complanatum TaxID=34168 RepID=A0ACC2E324_DIPCM|nr:hypothetical protein O6H91_04G140600 [Diphasiastrum complanatum]